MKKKIRKMSNQKTFYCFPNKANHSIKSSIKPSFRPSSPSKPSINHQQSSGNIIQFSKKDDWFDAFTINLQNLSSLPPFIFCCVSHKKRKKSQSSRKNSLNPLNPPDSPIFCHALWYTTTSQTSQSWQEVEQGEKPSVWILRKLQLRFFTISFP